MVDMGFLVRDGDRVGGWVGGFTLDFRPTLQRHLGKMDCFGGEIIP